MNKTQSKKSTFARNLMMNPIIRKLDQVTEKDQVNCSSYQGIAAKTLVFMIAAVLGIASYFVIHILLLGEKPIEADGYSFYLQEGILCLVAIVLSIIAPLIAMLIRPLIPVFGSLYCVSLGYALTMFASTVGREYVDLIYLALGITILLVSLMAFVYASGMVKVDKRFRTIVTIVFLTCIFSGLIGFILSFIPGVRSTLSFVYESPILTIFMEVIYVIIACAFLLVDFDTIQKIVENQLPKKYEWMAAFGLAYTVIYLFLKILNLLLTLTSKNK